MVVLHNDDFGAHYDVANDLLLFFVLGRLGFELQGKLTLIHPSCFIFKTTFLVWKHFLNYCTPPLLMCTAYLHICLVTRPESLVLL